MKKTSIAIDGPSGAGKSTISKLLAKQLNFTYVDTGAIYRTVGLDACRAGICAKSEAEVVPRLKNMKIDIRHVNGTQRVLLNGEDVSEEIRTHIISQYASDVSSLPRVRAFLLEMQRAFAEKYDVIMDGRDIGTVVLPHADIKIFLTASDEDRARRRFLELCERGADISFEQVLGDMRLRDAQDSGRAVAPLVPAEDAIIVDTTGNTLEESVALIEGIIKERLC